MQLMFVSIKTIMTCFNSSTVSISISSEFFWKGLLLIVLILGVFSSRLLNSSRTTSISFGLTSLYTVLQRLRSKLLLTNFIRSFGHRLMLSWLCIDYSVLFLQTFWICGKKLYAAKASDKRGKHWGPRVKLYSLICTTHHAIIVIHVPPYMVTIAHSQCNIFSWCSVVQYN